ncbi:MAG: selA [Anaerosporomusa subterranea]|jgi:L-seryl-tRNA(Ser) seleniumtransferase|nr:selA [Anaerosporomusa subterranea]
MSDLNLRNIPSVDKLLNMPSLASAVLGLPRTVVLQAVRETLAKARQTLLAGGQVDISTEALLAAARRQAMQLAMPSLKRVINATGLVLHTNLGRAPLSRRAAERTQAILEGYSTLEYDVESGGRGSRYDHVADRLSRLTGAEAALVVNNNAAAVLLTLAALAAGKEVLVSRGQLVEVGGAFRIPDVMRQSGVKLVEVGTTNRTRIADYQEAITPETAAIMKVHTSNFRICGFTEQPTDAELCALAREQRLVLLDDLGSGTLLPLELGGWREPAVLERIAAGMDVVTFSGDKLLGGSQAGIIAGKQDCIAKIKKHPLLRALRVDKLTLAALEGTLLDYEIGDPKIDIPALRLLTRPVEEVKHQAEHLAHQLGAIRAKGWFAKAAPMQAQSGGGAFPAVEIASFGVRLTVEGRSINEIELALRSWTTPIICRLQENAIYLDVRCVSEEDMKIIRTACLSLAGVASE